jgi:acyl-CoA reductase-like NAD-dependent aldehyde dehydrogenase
MFRQTKMLRVAMPNPATHPSQRRSSRQTRAGTVSVNCFSEGDQAVPFGGYKQSVFAVARSLCGGDRSLLVQPI